MQFILMFGLPFPLFFGLLVTRKDTIDYMLPGVLGYGFDFGYDILGLDKLRTLYYEKEMYSKNQNG